MTNKIPVDVSYCLPKQQSCIDVVVEEGATVREAIMQSGLLQAHGLDIEGEQTNLKVGIYGRECSLDTVLNPGDRVEIYRPLLLSPTEARRLRAKLDAEKPSA